jgi:hypothetical protein
MVQVVQASQLELYEVEEKFNLRQALDEDFFPEWQGVTPELMPSEGQWLDQVKADFLYLLKYSLHEEVVKLVVLSPLMIYIKYWPSCGTWAKW